MHENGRESERLESAPAPEVNIRTSTPFRAALMMACCKVIKKKAIKNKRFERTPAGVSSTSTRYFSALLSRKYYNACHYHESLGRHEVWVGDVARLLGHSNRQPVRRCVRVWGTLAMEFGPGVRGTLEPTAWKLVLVVSPSTHLSVALRASR